MSRKLGPYQLLRLIALTIAFYMLSILLLDYYTKGDQVHYSMLYESLATASGNEVMSLAKMGVNSVEPISAYTLWVGARLGLSKNLFISILNVTLLHGIIILLWQKKTSWPVQFLVASNFYTFVLLTGTERLKIAYILLVYAGIFRGKLGVALALASPLAHLQSFILLCGLATSRSVAPIKMIYRRGRISKPTIYFFITTSSIVLLVFLYLIEGLVNKAIGYMQLVQIGNISNLFKVVFLMGLGLFIGKDRLKVGITIGAMLIPIIFLGDDRVNMIAVTLFLYLMLEQGRIQHPLVILVLMYFSAKSIPFLYNIFRYNDGFVSGTWLF